MTQTQHYTGAATFTVPAGITKIRTVVAGAGGEPASVGPVVYGNGAVLSALISTIPAATFAVSFRAGGAGGTVPGGNGGAGGDAALFADIIAGGGGGANGVGTRPGDAGAPGSDGQSAPIGAGSVAPGGGTAAGLGGVGGVNGSPAGSAGKSNADGGAGGAAASTGSPSFPSGGGGAGFGGGGGGGLAQTGAGGSSSAGSYGAVLTGYNTSLAYVDVFWAATPLVPTLIGPIGNAWADRTQPIILSFHHNAASADALDAQTDADVRHRKVGTSTWTTVSSLGTATSYSIPAGTYADGDQVEWQVRTYADGQQGPWSDSALFTAATPPDTPVITTPSDSATIGTAAIVIAWTHDGQVAYQARVVNDVGGSAPAQPIVYADSGPVVSGDLTTTLTVKVNEVDAHVQVRCRDIAGGLWSPWADVLVSILWEPPPVPRVTRAIDEKCGALIVAIVNPAPEGVQPDASVNRVFITEGGVEQAPVMVAPSTTWTYWTPVGDVAVRVEAVDESTGVLSSTGVIW